MNVECRKGALHIILIIFPNDLRNFSFSNLDSLLVCLYSLNHHFAWKTEAFILTVRFPPDYIVNSLTETMLWIYIPLCISVYWTYNTLFLKDIIFVYKFSLYKTKRKIILYNVFYSTLKKKINIKNILKYLLNAIYSMTFARYIINLQSLQVWQN